jgi:hypothetical protein
VHGYFPQRVPPDVRELIVKRFPALRGDSGNAVVNRRIADKVLFSPFRMGADGRLGVLLTSEELASLAGVHSNAGNWSAGREMDRFGREVFELDRSPWDYQKKQARVVRPVIDEDIRGACSHVLMTPPSRINRDWVWFCRGTPASQESIRQEHAERQRTLLQRAYVPEGRPARPLWVLLRRQPGAVIRGRLEANWGRLEDAVSALPEGSESLRTHIGILQTLHEWPGPILYGPTERTERLHPLGINPLLLRSDLRKIALGGTVSLDLNASQISIIATTWEIPGLRDFLRAGGKFWEEMLNCSGLPESAKSALKNTVYPLSYGMSMEKLMHGGKIAGGDYHPGLVEVVGETAARLFFENPHMTDLFDRREQVQRQAKRRGWVPDGFGGRIPVNSQNPARAALAQQAQGVELYIMLALLPVLEAYPQVYITSWQHDGCTLFCENPDILQEVVEQAQAAVGGRTEEMGIPTWLEAKVLQ